jgi:bacillopeptidase F
LLKEKYNMRKPIYIFLIIPIFVFCIKFSAQAGTLSPDLQLVLEAKSPDQEVDVIVILTDQVDIKALVETKALKEMDKSLRKSEIITTLQSKADKTQKDLIKFLNDKKAKKDLSLWIFNGLAATVPADLILELARRPEVDEVRLDFAITLSEPIPATAATPEWNIDAIRAPQLWNLGFTGQNIVVANMDSGVDVNHNDLFPRWRGGTNSWFDPYGQWADPHDSHPAGHGTGTMGIMVGGDATGTAIGVAPGAQWIAVKMFNDAGEAPVSAIHQSFQWLLDPDGDPYSDDAPNVVNNSWGYRTLLDICYLEFQPDIQALKASEIAVVFSAGNEGIYGPASTSISPANNPESFAVGAIDMYQNIAGFSSRGPSACVLENDFFPEVVAPGVSVKTADLTFNGAFPINTRFSSGTSFAAPHVAGAMTLLLSAFPELTVSELEAALIDTAVDLGDMGPDNDYGFGMIDVMAAYRSLVPCTDADGDDFYVEAVCGTPQDCNDNDAGINPGTPEIKHDSIDQDCNGYDLTIDILSAEYIVNSDKLCVIATSELMDTANLELVGFDFMSWNAGSQEWSITSNAAGGNPGNVTVSGIEGIDLKATTSITIDICLGDFDSNRTVDAGDLSIFAAAFGSLDGDPNYNPAADFDGSGAIDGSNLAEFIVQFGRTDCPNCN